MPMNICLRCALHKSKINRIAGSGFDSARFLFIIETPAVSEDLIGKGFVSDANKLLMEIITKAGIPLTDCYFSYMVQCRACDSKRSSNRIPSEQEILACMPNVLETIGQINFQGAVLVDALVDKYYRARVHVPHIKITSPNLIKIKGGRASNLYIDTIQRLERFSDKINRPEV